MEPYKGKTHQQWDFGLIAVPQRRGAKDHRQLRAVGKSIPPADHQQRLATLLPSLAKSVVPTAPDMV
jgi:hypothetical protein